MTREHPENNLLLSHFEVKNLGPIPELKSGKLDRINLIIGENSCGKTYLMKGLYVACKAMESYRRGKDIRGLEEIVKNKLHWTFQPPTLGSIVRREGRKRLMSMDFSCVTTCEDCLRIRLNAKGDLQVSLTPDPAQRALSGRPVNSVFMPAKEVLTGHSVIVPAHEDERVFGFDDTYYDLAKILMRSPTKGKSYENMAKAREAINSIFGIKPQYDEESKEWSIQKGNETYSINEVSEGIKKLSILDILLGNRYIGPGSIIFIDEPESALHPAAISKFMEAISKMSQDGIQFFLATHSYFVVKKLRNIARETGKDIPVFSFQSSDETDAHQRWMRGNLRTDELDNPIIRESVKLYRDEIDQFLHE